MRALDATSLAPPVDRPVRFGPGRRRRSAAAASGDAVYVLARTLGTVVGPTNLAKTDWVVRKYLDDGTPVWTTQFGTAYTRAPQSASPLRRRASSSSATAWASRPAWVSDRSLHALGPPARHGGQHRVDRAAGHHPVAAAGGQPSTWTLTISASTSSAARPRLRLPITSDSLITMTLDGQPIGTRRLSSSSGEPSLRANDLAVHDGTVYVVGDTDRRPHRPLRRGVHQCGSPAVAARLHLDRPTTGSAESPRARRVLSRSGPLDPGDYSTLDVVVRKLNRSGETVWSERAGSPDADCLFAVAVAGDGGARQRLDRRHLAGFDQLGRGRRPRAPASAVPGPTSPSGGPRAHGRAPTRYAPERQRTSGRIQAWRDAEVHGARRERRRDRGAASSAGLRQRRPPRHALRERRQGRHEGRATRQVAHVGRAGQDGSRQALPDRPRRRRGTARR